MPGRWPSRTVVFNLQYVARNETFARLGTMPVDCAVSPQGDLVVCCHSAAPDWGNGPKGEGRIFKISYTDNTAPVPVLKGDGVSRESPPDGAARLVGVLTPATQPLFKLDYTPEPETVTVVFKRRVRGDGKARPTMLRMTPHAPFNPHDAQRVHQPRRHRLHDHAQGWGGVAGTRIGETATELHIALPGGIVARVVKNHIAKTEPMAVSPMPAGLDKALTPEELRDLMTYLLTPRPSKEGP